MDCIREHIVVAFHINKFYVGKFNYQHSFMLFLFCMNKCTRINGWILFIYSLMWHSIDTNLNTNAKLDISNENAMKLCLNIYGLMMMIIITMIRQKWSQCTAPFLFRSWCWRQCILMWSFEYCVCTRWNENQFDMNSFICNKCTFFSLDYLTCIKCMMMIIA